MVENLALETIEHPRPYNLAWLKNSQKVNVYKQCLVQFSIGDIYYDKVLCDVIPMDACHLILGRPWQYDRHTMHDGKHHTGSNQSELKGEFFQQGEDDKAMEACRITTIFHSLLVSIFMVSAFICYTIGKIYESIFLRNKQCIF
jgi:hypothetical protein